jgi:hypothetical protein
MVQSLIAPDGEINAEQLWKDVSPEQLMDAKLRCTFELPEEKMKEGNVSQLTSQMLKNESMNESLQTSVGDGVAAKNNDNDFVRATAEVRDLREENSKMRQENLELKVSFGAVLGCSSHSSNLPLPLPGANHPVEVDGRLAKVARFKLSPISQTHFESLFTAPTRTATADADHLGHRRSRHGHLRPGPRQVRPLNAFAVEWSATTTFLWGVVEDFLISLSFFWF